MKGLSDRREQEQRDRAWLAYHAGLIGRMKKPPSLEEMQGLKKKLKVQTPAEMRAAFASWRQAGQEA